MADATTPVSGNPSDKSSTKTVVSTRTGIFAEIEAECQRHVERGYNTAHDDEYGVEHLAIEIERRAKFHVAHTTDAQARDRLVRAAALAIAAIEVIDRRASEQAKDRRVDLNDLDARNTARSRSI